jgi:hypothetical protein
VASTQGQDAISPVTLFSIVVQIFVSMSLVLSASGRPEDHWLRTFTTCYLALMTLIYVGAMLYLMRRRKAAKESAGSGAQG